MCIFKQSIRLHYGHFLSFSVLNCHTRITAYLLIQKWAEIVVIKFCKTNQYNIMNFFPGCSMKNAVVLKIWGTMNNRSYIDNMHFFLCSCMIETMSEVGIMRLLYFPHWVYSETEHKSLDSLFFLFIYLSLAMSR